MLHTLQDPRKCPWNPYPKVPNFYPDVFGKFLSGKRIWVPTWAISIRTPDMAFFPPARRHVWHPGNSNFFLLLGFGNPSHVSFI